MESSHEPQVELIEFINPGDKTLLVPNITWPSGIRETLWEKLHTNFSKFGLIHSIYIGISEDTSTFRASHIGEEWYAYVSFYSESALKKAQLFLHRNLIISEAVCKVVPAKARPSKESQLPAHKCVELANYYLGFNGWSSEVVHKQLESSELIGDVTEQLYAVAVRLTLPDGSKAEGVGLATAEITNVELKSKAIAYAQKCAMASALKNAFSKIIIVIVDGKKAKASINTTKEDPFFYNPLWDKENLVTVNVRDVQQDSVEVITEE